MVRDFTETTEEELLQLIGDKQDELESGNINYYGMKYNTEAIDSDYVVLFQEINESVDAIVGNVTALQIYNEQLQETVQNIFSDARAKDEEWAEEVTADIPEIMENYLGNMNTLIESISCKTVGEVSQDGHALSKYSSMIFGNTDSFKESLSKVKSLAERCYEDLFGGGNEINYEKVYELLAMDGDAVELWQIEALCMLLGSYIGTQEEDYELNTEELEKFLYGAFLPSLPLDSIPQDLYMYFGESEVFKQVASYYNTMVSGIMLGYTGSIGDLEDGSEEMSNEILYYRNVAYLNGILMGVTEYYGDGIDINYTDGNRIEFEIQINTNNSNEKMEVSINNARQESITVYRWQAAGNAGEKNEQDTALANIKKPDSVYLTSLSTELESTVGSWVKNILISKCPGATYAYSISSCFNNAEESYNQAVENNRKNQRIYDNSVFEQICNYVYCDGTLVSCGDDYLVCNRHINQIQLTMDVAYYNACIDNYNAKYPDSTKTHITVEDIVYEMMIYDEDSSGFEDLKEFAAFEKGKNPEYDGCKPMLYSKYCQDVGDYFETQKGVSLERMQSACESVLGEE